MKQVTALLFGFGLLLGLWATTSPDAMASPERQYAPAAAKAKARAAQRRKLAALKRTRQTKLRARKNREARLRRKWKQRQTERRAAARRGMSDWEWREHKQSLKKQKSKWAKITDKYRVKNPERYRSAYKVSKRVSHSKVNRWKKLVARKYTPGTVVISTDSRRLYYVASRKRVIAYPVATPKRDELWSGTLRVSKKKKNPAWHPTPEMRERNPELPEKVEGGAYNNPLGSRALYLGNTLYRIHGTNKSSSIGRAVSSGCVRMHNSHIKDLYRRIRKGAPVVMTNRRI